MEAFDEVYVATSQMGFEALLMGKVVHTFGAPFYAGWGLTIDHGDIPGRRKGRPTLEQMFAALSKLLPLCESRHEVPHCLGGGHRHHGGPPTGQ